MMKFILAALLALLPLAAEASNCNSNPFTLTNGQTADATQVMSNFNNLLNCANNNLAHNGANTDITSLAGMTTPLSVVQGGTGLATITSNSFILGNGISVPAQLPLSTALRSYLSGLTLSNDVSTPNTVLDIAAGAAMNSTNDLMMALGAFTKSTGGTWVAGTGANGMGTGLTVAAGNWYAVCLVSISGTSDIYFDTDVNCASHSPASVTARRRIGAIKTDGSARILAFSQNGDEFLWSTTVVDGNALNIADATGHLAPLTVPSNGLIVNALYYGTINTGAGGSVCLTYTSPAVPDQASALTDSSLCALTSATASGQFNVRTDSAGNIRYRASGATGVFVYLGTYGWIDTRGRFN